MAIAPGETYCIRSNQNKARVVTLYMILGRGREKAFFFLFLFLFSSKKNKGKVLKKSLHWSVLMGKV
jgi:hypothetical protein